MALSAVSLFTSPVTSTVTPERAPANVTGGV
jgi:hypothetical protein